MWNSNRRGRCETNMGAEITSLDNVLRGLRHLGLEDAFIPVRVEEDRVYGWDRGGALLAYVKLMNWDTDLIEIANAFHKGNFRVNDFVVGEVVLSAREPMKNGQAVYPAMQIVFYSWPPNFVSIDYDIASPLTWNPVSTLIHIAEVVWHWITGTKTSQKRISKLLDRRFGKE